VSEIGNLAPMVVVMLPEAIAFAAQDAAFERTAGPKIHTCTSVSLL